MSSPAARLPVHPSLENLRKQAKSLLRELRNGDTVAVERFRTVDTRLIDPARAGPALLSDAQFVLAREYGFESWPRLVHHVEGLEASTRLEELERLGADLAAAYAGDTEAYERLGSAYGISFTPQQLRMRVRDRLPALKGSAGAAASLTRDDARLIVAQELGFESWTRLAESVSQPPGNPRAASLGISVTPPFYRIDWAQRTIEPRAPLSDKDWDRILGLMEEHDLTGLHAGGLMTDAVLARLPEQPQITHLHMGGSKRISDEGLQHLARMPQLVELDLSDYHSPITDRGLDVLHHLPELRRLELCWLQRISDAGLAGLASSLHLEKVNLMGTPTGDGALQVLRDKSGLGYLTTGRLTTDAGLALLHQFPVFKTWQGGPIDYGLMSFGGKPNNLLLDGPFTDAGLASLTGLDGVFGLGMFWHAQGYSAAGIAALAGLPRLGVLGCQGDRCDDAAMRAIATLPHLKMLMGQGAVAGDDGWTALSRSPTIEYIWGRECPHFTSRGFAALATMPALRGLGVSCQLVDDAALSLLPGFPSLDALVSMDIPDAGFRHVGRCEALEQLWCMYCQDTGDIATEHLSGLTRLRSYYAGASQITDGSLRALGRMTSLEKLEFWECVGISDAGVKALTALPRLRELTVSGSPRVTREGAAIFPASVQVSYH